MYDYSPENIVALATPPGRGALAIVRFSGTDLCSTYRAFSKKKPIDRRAVYSKIYHPNSNKLLDEAIITFFKSPNSFTGEDVIEISCHGGTVVPHSIVLAAIDSGARNASPGEFSLRAFLNGKIDLLQAEAVASLISSKSQFGADACLHHLRGRVSNILSNIKTDTIEVLATIENELNFSEDEIDFISYNQISEIVIRIQNKIKSILEASTFGKDLLLGFRVVIVGKPNSGKSSLFNALLGFERAIVSNIPGTTRDTIEASFDLGGLPICIVDTAGIWESDNALDTLGVQKTMDALNQAHICILVDDTDPRSLIKSHFSQRFLDSCILVKSKCDDLNSQKQNNDDIFYLSSKKGLGIDKLLTHLSTYISERFNASLPLEHMLITRRQRKLLEVSLDSINGAYKQILSGVETDIIASSLNGFVLTIGDVIGEVPTKDVLNHIFNNFCVGK